MPSLVLKPTHKPVKNYYAALQQLAAQGATHEGAVKTAFQGLLESCASQRQWTLLGEYEIRRPHQHPLRVDAALRDNFWITHGYWEAKDTADDLEQEARKKFAAGYPQDNILFQSPDRALLFQDRQLVLDADLTHPDRLVAALNAFFAYTKPAIEEWDKAVAEFQQRVPDLGQSLTQVVEDERRTNPQFVVAFNDFANLCRASLNPNLRDEAVEEMLIQHLLTERLFRKVFANPEFVKRNAIAQQIEKVIDALSGRSFSRDEFLGKLSYFYRAIEDAAATITDFSQKQKFLNTIYEKFFQGFCVKVADTHGIVYTPPPIVRFMVASVEHLLKTHFGKSIASPNVHVLDPFGGTGNFHVHLMQHIPKTALARKYAGELWVNEIMLLPYYVCCMNIEHAYYEATGQYLAFPGACLVDTFETAEKTQHEFGFMSHENVERVKRQKAAPIFVIISNPPYNAGQTNENDNNKNRTYPAIDSRVRLTYSADSTAKLVRKLSDPYIKAIRFATDRIGDAGIVCFVSNNSFVTDLTFDGMRKHLAADFDRIYVLDLGGNMRKGENSAGNVFGIRVGVSINLFVRQQQKAGQTRRAAEILYDRVPDDWSRTAKLGFLDKVQHAGEVEWKKLVPDTRHCWFVNDNEKEYAGLVPLGIKSSRSAGGGSVHAVLCSFSPGVNTARDQVVYDFNSEQLALRVEQFYDDYSAELARWRGKGRPRNVDNFVTYGRLKWSYSLKHLLTQDRDLKFDRKLIRSAIYRPFTTRYLYLERGAVDRVGGCPEWFPTTESEFANRVIALGDAGSRSEFTALMCNRPFDLHVGASTDLFQGFPFYAYAEDGSERRENITDWALKEFQTRYSSSLDTRHPPLTKWDIFHYVYAVLHHPQYRERYAANLRRELPRIPFVAADVRRLHSKPGAEEKEDGASSRRLLQDAEVFRAFAAAGKRLAELHVNYEQQPEYLLERMEKPGEKLNWRVEKMKLVGTRSTASQTSAKRKNGDAVESVPTASIIYNEFLTLASIPKEAFDYRLGNRSALEWVIDQYQVSTDQRSGITNDPNRPDDPEYIVRLLGQVITVSLETVKVVRGLPALVQRG